MSNHPALNDRYSRMSQLYHWLSALLIIYMLFGGTVMTRFLDGDMQTLAYRGHVTFGLLLVLLTVGRLVWLFTSRRPAPLPMPRMEQLGFTWNHNLLYVLLVVMLISGPSMLLLSGIGLNPLTVTPDAIQEVPPIVVHNIVSKVMIALLVMHIAGVIFYQATRGNTLGRMGINWFARK